MNAILAEVAPNDGRREDLAMELVAWDQSCLDWLLRNPITGIACCV
jgi:hypothetical protein